MQNNSTIDGIESADAVLIIGSNPRLDAPLVNTRLRKAWIAGGMDIGLIGEAVDLTYEYEHLGANPSDIATIAKATKGFAKKFKAAKNPAIIIGSSALARQDGAQILRAVGVLAAKTGVVRDGWNGFNVLHTAAARVAGDTSKLKNAFVIYQGSHGDAGAHLADVILPSSAYTEKDGLYVNLEGRVQMGARAVAPKGQAKDDWAIIRALSGHLDRELEWAMRLAQTALQSLMWLILGRREKFYLGLSKILG